MWTRPGTQVKLKCHLACHDTTRYLVHAFWKCRAWRTARLDTLVRRATRRMCRVETWCDVTSQVEFGLYTSLHMQWTQWMMYIKTAISKESASAFVRAWHKLVDQYATFGLLCRWHVVYQAGRRRSGFWMSKHFSMSLALWTSTCSLLDSKPFSFLIGSQTDVRYRQIAAPYTVTSWKLWRNWQF